MVDNLASNRASSGPIIEAPNGVKYAYNPFAHTHSEECDQSTVENADIYCSQCSITLGSIDDLENHNVAVHGQKKLLTCSQCSAQFRRQDHLKRHMQSLHYNQKYCVCPVCKQDFKRQDILLKHIKRKHTTNNEIFHCRECEFECRTHNELEKHETLTHLFTERHICVHCNATFKRRDYMLRHVRSQHLNQSVICPICKQSYKRRDHVARHVREKHKMGYINGKLLKAQDFIIDDENL